MNSGAASVLESAAKMPPLHKEKGPANTTQTLFKGVEAQWILFEFGGLFIFIRRDVDKTTRVGWVDRLRNLEQISA